MESPCLPSKLPRTQTRIASLIMSSAASVVCPPEPGTDGDVHTATGPLDLRNSCDPVKNGRYLHQVAVSLRATASAAAELRTDGPGKRAWLQHVAT